MDDETLLIGIALRIGLDICLAHQCQFGVTVQSDGFHPLSCRFNAGRFSRHTAINSAIKRSLDSAGLQSILEPVCLNRGDGKGGKALARDATRTDSFTASNQWTTILNHGSASSTAEDLKKRKYPKLVEDFLFVPVAVETSEIIGSAGCFLLTDISGRISMATNDPHQTSYVFQQI